MAEEMVKARVARRQIELKLAEGYTPIKGKGPDGLAWDNGDLLMQIPKSKYDALQKERAAASDNLRAAIRRRQPLATPPADVSVHIAEPEDVGKNA